MLIGLTGLAGSGKSEVAGYMASMRGFERMAFADPLKEMLLAAGLTRNQVYGNAKGEVDERFGVTPRRMMQLLGTEFARKMIHPLFWVILWEGRADERLALGRSLVVEDVRFANEAEAIQARGGFVWRISRPGIATMDHESENQAVPADYVIENDRGLYDLHAKVLTAVADMAHMRAPCA